MNVRMHMFFQISGFLFFSNMYPGVELLGHPVVLFLVFFEKPLYCFSTVAAPIYIPTNSVGGFSFLHILATFVFVFFFDYSHTYQCKVISHCGFNLYFPDDERCWASFHVPLDHLHALFGKMSIQVFGPFLNQATCFFFDIESYELFICFGC